jgi:phospholipid/cholesterol/gamma-HCH transport system permease protein
MNMIRQISESQDSYVLSGRSLSALPRRPFYLGDTIEQMDYTGAGSLPIILIASVFVGMALSLQLETQLAFMGLENYTGRVVAMAVIREIGLIIVALVYAGRVGSRMTSELGSMVLDHQVDTLRVFGVDPVKKLVIPRMLSTVAMLPALTIIGDTASLLGRYYIAVYMSHLSGSTYWLSVRTVLSFGYVFPGIIKPFVFGYLIACISCHMGLATRGAHWDSGVLRGGPSWSPLWPSLFSIFSLHKVVIYLIGY